MREAHYLTPYTKSTLPRVHICFDTETRLEKVAGKMSHKWVCGAYRQISRTLGGDWRYRSVRMPVSSEELWREMTQAQLTCDDIVVWAHNLAFDLRISGALEHLPRLGYQLEAISLANSSAWSSWSSPLGKLTVCDLGSWFPAPLTQLANDLKMSRLHLDYATATDQQLEERCEYDVITTTVIIQHLLKFLDVYPVGPFRPTGSGQSHSFWRRQYLPASTVMIHSDDVALERERTAMWTGRAEAWRHGKVTGPLYEWDMKLAYCNIAAACRVPVRLIGKSAGNNWATLAADGPSIAHLSDVTVTTDRPCVPVEVDGRIIWPVGTFRTTLWDPELRVLVAEMQTVTVHRTWRYHTEPVLAEMAQWLLWQLTDRESNASPLIQRMLKHWARTLVGRCALRYRKWEDYGTVPHLGLSLAHYVDLDTGEESEILQVGKRMLELAAMEESETSLPQITGWVMSEARRRLWNLMLIAGLENIVYVDTDGLIVTDTGNRNLLDNPETCELYALECKAMHSRATVYGPRNIRFARQRRLAGVPRSATELSPLEFEGETWQSLQASLETSHRDQVAVHHQPYKVRDIDPRRQRIANGMTEPYRLEGHETI